MDDLTAKGTGVNKLVEWLLRREMVGGATLLDEEVVGLTPEDNDDASCEQVDTKPASLAPRKARLQGSIKLQL